MKVTCTIWRNMYVYWYRRKCARMKKKIKSYLTWWNIALLNLRLKEEIIETVNIFVNLLWNIFSWGGGVIFLLRALCEERRVSEDTFYFSVLIWDSRRVEFHPWRKSHHSSSWLHSNVRRTGIIISNRENFCLSPLTSLSPSFLLHSSDAECQTSLQSGGSHVGTD